jgi:hypothetical protein
MVRHEAVRRKFALFRGGCLTKLHEHEIDELRIDEETSAVPSTDCQEMRLLSDASGAQQAVGMRHDAVV